MSRFTLVTAVGTAAVLALAGCSAAGGTTQPAAASTTPSGAGQESTGTATIITTGTGTVTATPDVMTVVLGVNTTATSATDALNQNNALATDVITVLKGSGIADADLQTSELSVNPNVDDKGVITGYQVTNSVTATLRDISTAGAVIDAVAQKAGDAVRVQQVGFSLSDDSEQRAAARVAAVTEAQMQARQLAGAAGVELGAIVSLTESSPGSPITYLAAADSAGVPIQAGSTAVSIVVQAVYSVNQ